MADITLLSHDTGDPHIEALRAAFSHRAQWAYLLLDEARRAGLDWEAIGRAAMHRAGLQQAARVRERMGADDVTKLSAVYGAKGSNGYRLFAARHMKDDETGFHAQNDDCPLLAGWIVIGAPDDMLPALCDIVMDADRAMNEVFNTFRFTLHSTLAEGAAYCDMRFDIVT